MLPGAVGAARGAGTDRLSPAIALFQVLEVLRVHLEPAALERLEA